MAEGEKNSTNTKPDGSSVKNALECSWGHVHMWWLLLLKSKRLGIERPIILDTLFVIRTYVIMVKKTGWTIDEDGLNYNFVEQQQKVQGNRKFFEFADVKESLLAVFVVK